MKKTTASPRPRSRKAAAPKSSTASTPVAAAPAPRQGGKKGLIMVVFLLLCVGLAAQAYLLWRKDQKSKLVLNFVNVLSVNGRDQDGQFCCARDMAVDNNGDVLVLEAPEVGHKLQKFAPSGKFIAAYHPKGEAQIFKNGSGVATGPDNKVYVVETGAGQIKVLSPDLKFIKNLPIPSHATAGMAINSKGEFLICDQEKASILHLDKDGNLISRIEGGKKRIGGPYRLALSASDDIFLLDFPRGMNAEPDIKVFGPAGEYKTSWTVRGFQANPYNSIAWHPKGAVVVNDNCGTSLAKGLYFFDEKGKSLGNALFSDNQLSLKNTSNMAIDRKRGDIYLNTNTIQRGGDRFTWNPEAVAAE
jgi:hypothetical protein